MNDAVSHLAINRLNGSLVYAKLDVQFFLGQQFEILLDDKSRAWELYRTLTSQGQYIPTPILNEYSIAFGDAQCTVESEMKNCCHDCEKNLVHKFAASFLESV